MDSRLPEKFGYSKGENGDYPILVFPNWKKPFHVNLDASWIALGIILAQLGEGGIDHPIAFARRKLSSIERNYTTMEREGLAMVYAL